MTCDEAFDRMTSEAELTPATRAHLAGCPRCREMHDTLSPALEALESEPPRRASPWLEAGTASSEAQVGMSVLRYSAILLVGATFGMALMRPAASEPTEGARIPSAACTRGLVQSSTDAKALVRTCIACHKSEESSRRAEPFPLDAIQAGKMTAFLTRKPAACQRCPLPHDWIDHALRDDADGRTDGLASRAG
jgi:cytochrome c553